MAGTAPQNPRAWQGSEDDTNRDQAWEGLVPTLPSRSRGKTTQCALPVGSPNPPQVVFTSTLGHDASS